MSIKIRNVRCGIFKEMREYREGKVNSDMGFYIIYM